MSYKSLAKSMNPIAYWDIDNVSESNLTKSSTTDSNRSIFYGEEVGGSMLIDSSSTITASIDNIELSSFTISFWYQQLSDISSNTNTILKTTLGGTAKDISLETNSSGAILTFAGTRIYTRFSDTSSWRSPHLISITYSYTNGQAALYIDNTSSTASVSNYLKFNKLEFSTTSGNHYQISGLAVYKPDLGASSIAALANYRMEDNFELFNYYHGANSITNVFQSSKINRTDTMNKDNIILRNCYLDGNSLKMYDKSPCLVNGSKTYSSSGVTLGADGGIDIPVSELSNNDRQLKIHIDSLSSASGVVFYMYGQSSIKVSVSSGDLYLNDVSVCTLASDNYVYVIFNSNNLYLKYNGIEYPEASVKFFYPLNAIIGNDINYENHLTNKIIDFAINYIEEPLASGVYSVDFTKAYTVDSIKPNQDAAAIWIQHIPANTARSTIRFDKEGISSVKTYTTPAAGWMSDYGSTISVSGNSILDGTAPISTTTESSTVYVLFNMSNSQKSDDQFIINPASIKNVSISSLSSTTLLSDNSSIELSSSNSSAAVFGKTTTINPKNEISFMSIIDNSSSIIISGVDSSIREASIRIRMGSSASSGHIYFKNGLVSIADVQLSVTGNTYVVSGGSSLYVDGAVYSGASLSIYNDYLLDIVVSSQFDSIEFSGLNGFSINSIDLFTTLNNLRPLQFQSTRSNQRISAGGTNTFSVSDVNGAKVYNFTGISILS